MYIICPAYLFLLIGVFLYRSCNLVQFNVFYYGSFQVHLVGFIHCLLLCFMSFSTVYASVSLILAAVFGVVYVGAYSAPCFLPVSTLGMSLLLASKVLLDFYPIIVQSGFILEAIYNYSFTNYCSLHFLGWQVNYQGTIYFSLLRPRCLPSVCPIASDAGSVAAKRLIM